MELSSGSQALAGFWIRLLATVLDGFIISLALYPLGLLIYPDSLSASELPAVNPVVDFAYAWLSPAVVTIACWLRWRATPGKLLTALQVVDARTGDRISLWQGVLRYAGYFGSALALGAGFLWIAFHPRKQGWHDILAGTVVVTLGRVAPDAAAESEV